MRSDTVKVIISKTDLHDLRDAVLKEECVDIAGNPFGMTGFQMK